MGRRMLILSAIAALLPYAARAEAIVVRIGYLRWAARWPTISLRDKPAKDDGLAGAALATNDDNRGR
jgi:hypothetical protein